MNQRLDIIKQTLAESDYSAVLYSMIADLEVDEWLFVLENKESYEDLLPFLLITYNPSVVDQMIDEAGVDAVVAHLMEIWFSFYFRGVHGVENIDIGAVTSKPGLSALFSGHLLSVFARSSQEGEVAEFVREYTRALNEMIVSELRESPELSAGYIAGVNGGDEFSKFYPRVADWDEADYEKPLTFMYFLASLTLVEYWLDFGKGMSLKRKELLAEGNVNEVIETSSHSSLDKLRFIREYEDVEAFIVSTYTDFEFALSDFILSDNEMLYIASLLSQGKLISKRANDAQVEQGEVHLGDSVSAGDSVESEALKGVFGDEQEQEQEPVQSESPLNKIKTWFHHMMQSKEVQTEAELKNKFSEPVVEEVEDDYQVKEQSQGDGHAFDDFVKTRKRKGSSLSLFVIICVSLLAVFAILTVKVSSDEQPSIIEKNTDQTESEYPVVLIEP